MGRESHTEATTRLFCLIASQATSAVILRRGPSKQVRMLSWNLSNDEITGGQWLAGRVYNERCGLSPDGKLLVYFCGKFGPKIHAFTAISRPPYFTALALWPDESTWGGGGFFEANRKVILNYASVVHELNDSRHIPDDFEISTIGEYRARHPAPDPIAGWTLVTKGSEGERRQEGPMRVVFEPPWVFGKQSPVNPQLLLEQHCLGMFEVDGPSSVYRYRLVRRSTASIGAPAAEDLGRLDWADWDHDGSLLSSKDGRLYRRRIPASARQGDATSFLVADLCDQKFENIPPSDEAKTWPSPQ